MIVRFKLPTKRFARQGVLIAAYIKVTEPQLLAPTAMDGRAAFFF